MTRNHEYDGGPKKIKRGVKIKEMRKKKNSSVIKGEARKQKQKGSEKQEKK